MLIEVRASHLTDKDRILMSSTDMARMLCIILGNVFEMSPNRFSPYIKSQNDIRKRYYSNITWRRMSHTRVIEQGIDDKDIDMVNRWSDMEKSRKSKLNQSRMKQHYTQIELLINPFKRYTWAVYICYCHMCI